MSNFFKHKITLTALFMSLAVAPTLASEMGEDESNPFKRGAPKSSEQQTKRLKIDATEQNDNVLGTGTQLTPIQKLAAYEVAHEKNVKNLLGIFHHGLECDSPILESLYHALILTHQEAIDSLQEIRTLRLENGGQDIEIQGLQPAKGRAINALVESAFNGNGFLKNYLQLDNRNLTLLPLSLGVFTNINTLNLQKNQLTVLPDSLKNLTNLQYLDLSQNQLTKLPNSFAQLVNLESLFLRHNKLTVFPDSFGNLTNLMELHLSYNKLTGLPTSIGNLTNLQYLALSNNQMTELHDSFVNLTNMCILELSENQLTALPDSIAHLTGLGYFELSDNPAVDTEEKRVNLLKRFSKNVELVLEKDIWSKGTKEDA